MDGYAVRAADTLGADADNPMSLTVVGESLPGIGFEGALNGGEALAEDAEAPALPASARAVLLVLWTATAWAAAGIAATVG